MANKQYRILETTKWFVPAAAAQAEDAALEMHNLAAGAGVQSAYLDLGTSAVAGWYEWVAFCQFADTPVLGELVNIWCKRLGHSASATAHPANDDGTTASAVSSINKLNNLQLWGSIRVDEAAANIEMTASGLVYIASRAIQIVVWNATADALTNDVDENGVFLTPVPPEMQ